MASRTPLHGSPVVALVEPEECDNCDSTTDVDPASGLCPTCLWTTEGAPS